MADSGIEWCTDTWNPTTGCDQISKGCDNCYALARAARLKAAGVASYQTDGDPRTSGPGFGLALHPQRLDVPLRATRPRIYFVNSMSDLFHKDVPMEFVAEIFAVMSLAERHVFQILTKRPKRMAQILGDVEYYDSRFGRALFEATQRRAAEERLAGRRVRPIRDFKDVPYPLPNVWLGTSIETSKFAFRADWVRRTPAAVRFVSAEPLLGDVAKVDWTGLDWVIFGGESGARARPMEIEWVEDAIARVWEKGGRVFTKQLGTVLSSNLGLGRGKGGEIERWPSEVRRSIGFREMPVAGIPATV